MAKIIVYHTLYGCDTGCCGHEIRIDDRRVFFDFAHPSSKEELLEWAKAILIEDIGEEHLKDVDWENSLICDYDTCER